MAALLYQVLSCSAFVSLGVYHMVCSSRNHLKSPQSSSSYIAKPYHPLPYQNRLLRYLQLYLIIGCLLVTVIHLTVTSLDADPLLKGRTPVHRLTSLQSAAALFLFMLLTLAILVSEWAPSFLPLSSDLVFGLAAALFYMHSSVSWGAASDLQAKCDSLSGRISALASLLCLILACQPQLFVADVGLGAAMFLQGLWVLQSGLSLYADAFIPEGCHKLLDVPSGVEGSTRCELDESRFRAVAILDLLFLLHLIFVLIIFMVTYALVAKSVGGGGFRKMASYEALPTTAPENSHNHIQMKALSGTQA